MTMTKAQKQKSGQMLDTAQLERLIEVEHKGASVLEKKADVKQVSFGGKVLVGLPVVMGSASDAAKTLVHQDERFICYDFVRSDHGVWSRPENAASLPLGCLSWPHWPHPELVCQSSPLVI